jgi:uncharacterized protein YeaO (DUF488 family)
MKLQKHSSRKKGDPNYEKYVKWVLVIPQDRINQLGWKEGTEITENIKGDSLVLASSKKVKSKNKEEVLYEDFGKSIKNILERHPSGLTWTQIRDKLNLPQKYPNNKWVRKLERDINLKRIKTGQFSYWNFEHDTIYTIGYEGYIIQKFIKKLRNSNIQQLIDVRELPLSRKNGFSKTILKEELKKVGILYKHIPELGSPKKVRHQLYKDLDYEKFFKEYKQHINDADILDNISDIEGRARRKKTVLLCYEKDYKVCHRSIIAEELKRRGWKVNNL